MRKLRADLHIHSKYAMATSPRSDLDSFSEWAKYKGINLLGSADFCHPIWFKELKTKLKETSGKGIYEYKETKYILQNEVSTVYYKNGKCKKIHHLIYSPSFEVVEQIIDALKKKFVLKRNFWNYPALVAFRSKKLTDLVYFSKWAQLIHDIMYTVRKRPIE